MFQTIANYRRNTSLRQEARAFVAAEDVEAGHVTGAVRYGFLHGN